MAKSTDLFQPTLGKLSNLHSQQVSYLEVQVEGLRAEVSHLKSKLQATRLRASPAATPFPQPQEPAPNRHVEAWVRLVLVSAKTATQLTRTAIACAADQQSLRNACRLLERPHAADEALRSYDDVRDAADIY